LNRSVLLVGECANLGREGGWRLAGEQVEVRKAVTAADALREHRATPADLMVMDLDLPDTTAEQLCEEVRQDEALRSVSLLVLCSADESERRRAADCRANARKVTPVDADALAREILPLLTVPSRAIYRVLARVQRDEASGPRFFFCTSANLSTGGILLETTESLHVGEALGLSFFLPGKVRVEGRGSVVREVEEADGQRQFGVQFDDLTPEALAAIERFVADWTWVR
jgi:DNA-binding response OmpR family regulator